MSLPLRHHPAVWQEFDAAIRYYAREAGARIVLDFEACIFRNFDEIRGMPQTHRRRGDDVRRVNLGPQFQEWYLAFIMWNDSVVVIALGHAKRRPYYFRNRRLEAQKIF